MPNGFIGLDWLGPTPGLTRERGTVELGVSLSMARLDSEGVSFVDGVKDCLVVLAGGVHDFLTLGKV